MSDERQEAQRDRQREAAKLSVSKTHVGGSGIQNALLKLSVVRASYAGSEPYFFINKMKMENEYIFFSLEGFFSGVHRAKATDAS